MQRNCLECAECYDFDDIGEDSCVCGHPDDDHYTEERDHPIPYPECVNNDCPLHPYVL